MNLIPVGIAQLVALLLASPAYAAIHLVIDAGQRAMVMAFILPVSNLAGMVAGPVFDQNAVRCAAARFGEAPLQTAIMALLFPMPLAAFHFFRAARFIRADMNG